MNDIPEKVCRKKSANDASIKSIIALRWKLIPNRRLARLTGLRNQKSIALLVSQKELL